MVRTDVRIKNSAIIALGDCPSSGRFFHHWLSGLLSSDAYVEAGRGSLGVGSARWA